MVNEYIKYAICGLSGLVLAYALDSCTDIIRRPVVPVTSPVTQQEALNKENRPIFQSIPPVLTYPDGTHKGYRPLREGENLDDVLKEGPVDSYVVPPKKPEPKNDGNYKCDILIINPDGTSYYSIKEFSPDGKFLREYQKPSDRIYKRNPQYDEPRTNPDSKVPARNPEDKEC